MTEREKGHFLTDSLRRQLADCARAPNESYNPQYRHKIRERVKGVLDQLWAVDRHLPSEDIEMIFTQYHPEDPEGKDDKRIYIIPDVNTRRQVIEAADTEKEKDELQDGMAKEVMKSMTEEPGQIRRFRNRVRDSIAFLFHGIMVTEDVKIAVPLKQENEFGETADYVSMPESPYQDRHIDFDLESVISEAIEQAAEGCGKQVEDCTVNIELRDAEDIESLKSQFERGELTDYDKLLRLHHETDVTMKEIQQRHDQLREEISNESTVGEPPEEVLDALNQDDE